MARKSFVQLSNDLLTAFPDNIAGLITPLILRTYLQSFLDAIRPAYAFLSQLPPAVQTVGTTYVPLVFNYQEVSSVPDYTAAMGTGTITRLAAGTTRITINADLELTQGRVAYIGISKNGAAPVWICSTVGEGSGKPASVSLVALLYEAAAATYQIQLKCDTAGTSITLSNVLAIAETVPVNAY